MEGMHQAADNFVEHCALQDGAFEVHQPLKEMALQIIGSAAFGYSSVIGLVSGCKDHTVVMASILILSRACLYITCCCDQSPVPRIFRLTS